MVNRSSPSCTIITTKYLIVKLLSGDISRIRTCDSAVKGQWLKPLVDDAIFIFGVKEEIWTLTSVAGHQGHNLTRLPISPPTPYCVEHREGVEPTTYTLQECRTAIVLSVHTCEFRRTHTQLIRSWQPQTEVLTLSFSTSERLSREMITVWVQRVDSNHRPLGYEPSKLPLLTLCNMWRREWDLNPRTE